jgi:hypothetical protein
VNTISFGRRRVEHDIRAGGLLGPQVLLAQVLDMSLDRGAALLGNDISKPDDSHDDRIEVKLSFRSTYQLLLKRNLLKLHLVYAGLGGAQEGGGCDESALHVGRQAAPEWRLSANTGKHLLFAPTAKVRR